MNGICNGTIFGVPASWGPGEGLKGQISLNLNLVEEPGFKNVKNKHLGMPPF